MRLWHAERGLSDDAQHAFATAEETDKVKALLILMRAPTTAQDATIRQHDLQPQHIGTSDAILQAARAAGIRGDIAADARLLA